ncbi:MAG: methyltransferase domain-containing protein [Anaerolineae bacterium]|nr:methyltransferase domain-containing protein [Anaerolineae bacterium]
MSSPLPNSGAAFDHIADRYDADSTDLLISRWIRERVWSWLTDIFQPGMRVLEIGCGTGEDAVWLAKRGVSVTATDASPHMLAVTQRKAEEAGVSALVTTRQLDLNAATSWDIPSHDGAFSNYGALNCIGTYRDLGAALSRIVRPGGRIGLAVMSPLCVWELLWHTLHRDLRTATRRLSGTSTAHIGGVSFPVYYPTPRRLIREFGSDFRLQHLRGLGVFLPPSDVYAALGKHPALARRLLRLETLTADHFPFNQLADHFWLELRRN